MKKVKQRSILTFFSTTTILLFIVVFIFNSLVIQHLVFSYRNVNTSQTAFSTIQKLFHIIRSNGYERGRVNVVMNYQGQLDEMKKFRTFVTKHRQLGNKEIQEVFSELSNSQLKYDQNTLIRLKDKFLITQKLQTEYLKQFKLPFIERDLTHDDKWFNHMSVQIGTLSTLTYSLIEKNSIGLELKPYAKMIYLLTMLRNHAGPVVSYMKATTFNRSSLSLSRMEELKYRKIMVKNLIERLQIVSEDVLHSSTLNNINNFGTFYQNQVLIDADYIAENDIAQFIAPVDFRSYLKKGVNALEQLNTITNDIFAQTVSIIEEKKREALLKLVITIALSLLVFIILFINMVRIYKLVYRRIIIAGQSMHELSANNTNIDIPNPLFNDEVGILEAGLIKFKDNILKLNNLNTKFEALSHQDSLTHLLNHERILEQLEKVHAESVRYEYSYCAIMVDIDWFKKVNDTYGHQIGDEVLQGFAQVLNRHIRNTDLLGRYGGEEFLIIFSHMTQQMASEMTEKIKDDIVNTHFSSEQINITASFGIAESRTNGEYKDIIRLADKALYQAKDSGRNCIVCHQN
jgi:diguanylate cyclase (GGDEF)-like protein